jgi:hypothetical protein
VSLALQTALAVRRYLRRRLGVELGGGFILNDRRYGVFIVDTHADLIGLTRWSAREGDDMFARWIGLPAFVPDPPLPLP